MIEAGVSMHASVRLSAFLPSCQEAASAAGERSVRHVQYLRLLLYTKFDESQIHLAKFIQKKLSLRSALDAGLAAQDGWTVRTPG